LQVTAAVVLAVITDMAVEAAVASVFTAKVLVVS
jgi:hypothetical protein